MPTVKYCYDSISKFQLDMTTYHGGLASRIYQEYICITQSNTKVGKWPK